ncbi:MAG TPA: hypothetical protein VGZ69_06410 [Candidatus Rhabdochlamydia sp.]|jgi:hypothetical protein|nr:hypothetical protein [Candidatus Rhabdochlamydia sp.]
MTSNIEPRSSFLYQSNECEKKQSSNSSEIDKKASVVADQALSNATWYTELPSAPNRKPSITNKISSETVAIISSTFKQKSTPPPRPIKTRSILTQGIPKINAQKKAFPPDLLDVINAKAALKPSKGKALPLPPSQKNESTIPSMTSPIPRKRTLFLKEDASPQTVVKTDIPKPFALPAPPPQENKPKFQPVSVADLTSLSEKKVSFQTEPAKDQGNSSSEISNKLPSKSILKKTPPLSNAEENESSNKADPSTEIHSLPESEENFNSATDELNKLLEEFGIDPV